ncbi:hypothetical protein EYZ11_006583 [Aspergillus tanneri]|uniref:NmrA-like domain-containing protein n=1 Tax=Aspergillus tanneri TaxID=1220188 RepID=A0A4S3JF30_9EURO|nr:uncharacterized protein ATNIH1004_008186 [Aspergillus tanneri]KAA8643990.1 hypothetical protein ATNIH1004_008186 [Aspergillus tanneri]THC93936.1 hypothetical protein EYZ11_006583 [Aspergillus tanneri]
MAIPPFRTVAVFGATGQVGSAVLQALVHCKEQSFDIIAFVSPTSALEVKGELSRVDVKRIDLLKATEEELAGALQGADVVVSALGGSTLHKQRLIQDAAAIAGVRRFYPSEFGMRQVAWLPGPEAYVHPVWALKMKTVEEAMKHPAIKAGRMSYTIVGCGEFYDVPKEPLLCPWLNPNANDYVIQAVGNPEAKMDYSSVHDLAAFLVASLCHPNLSENQDLGFCSDHISYSEIASLLQKHSGKPVRLNITSPCQMRAILKNPSSAPKELQTGSSFPVDFWMLLRHVQGLGDFWRPPGKLHNNWFPSVRPVSFDEYFAQLFKTSKDV